MVSERASSHSQGQESGENILTETELLEMLRHRAMLRQRSLGKIGTSSETDRKERQSERSMEVSEVIV